MTEMEQRITLLTPMTHLFMETTRHLDETADEDYYYSVKLSGQAVILLNLPHFEPETVQRAFNERNTLTFDQPFVGQTFSKFRDKEHFIFTVDNGPSEALSNPFVKMWLVRMARVLKLKSVTQESFAENHSKRNPLERVHVVENRALSNEVFTSKGVHKDCQNCDKRLVENMEHMAGEVEKCLKRWQYGGHPMVTKRGIGPNDNNFVFDDDEHLFNFLARSERLKIKTTIITIHGKAACGQTWR